jgi:hypothetical protein
MSGYQALTAMVFDSSGWLTSRVFDPFGLGKEIRDMSLKEYKDLKLKPDLQEKVIKKTVKIVGKYTARRSASGSDGSKSTF